MRGLCNVAFAKQRIEVDEKVQINATKATHLVGSPNGRTIHHMNNTPSRVKNRNSWSERMNSYNSDTFWRAYVQRTVR